MRRISWSALMWPADEGDEEPDDDAERDDDAEADVDADGGSGSGARRCGFLGGRSGGMRPPPASVVFLPGTGVGVTSTARAATRAAFELRNTKEDT